VINYPVGQIKTGKLRRDTKFFIFLDSKMHFCVGLVLIEKIFCFDGVLDRRISTEKCFSPSEKSTFSVGLP
jgi:hypothetical protein